MIRISKTIYHNKETLFKQKERNIFRKVLFKNKKCWVYRASSCSLHFNHAQLSHRALWSLIVNLWVKQKLILYSKPKSTFLTRLPIFHLFHAMETEFHVWSGWNSFSLSFCSWSFSSFCYNTCKKGNITSTFHNQLKE